MKSSGDMLILANPWGLLALVGWLAVLAIHLLRRRSRRVSVSTLFLVERALPSSEGGKKLRQLRNSWPLWWQLLAVLVIALLLAQPRWRDLVPAQTVVMVVDSSASMSAIREHVLSEARRFLAERDAEAEHTDWTILGSDSVRLGGGRDLATAWAQVEQNWHPVRRTHDTREAFRLARSLAGARGRVVFVTDHRREGDNDGSIQWLAVGRPIENVGFLGGTSNGDRWQALVKNFGTTERVVRWRVQGAPQWREVTLAAGQMFSLDGGFPGTDRVLLELEGDQFPLDDTLPIMQEQPKSLSVRKSAEAVYQPLLDQVVSLTEPSVISPEEADVSLEVYDTLSPRKIEGSAVVFAIDASKTQRPLTGLIVAEQDPLMESLIWQGLIAHDTFSVPPLPGDEVLLWQGTRPLIFQRRVGDGVQLIFNFDVRQSNATRLPAFALLLHRFFAQVRADKVARETRNVETGQALTVAGAGAFTSPDRPEFFEVKGAEEKVLLVGAAQFAEPRESDFRLAATDAPSETEAQVTQRTTLRGSFVDPLLALILLGFFLANWWATGRVVRS